MSNSSKKPALKLPEFSNDLVVIRLTSNNNTSEKKMSETPHSYQTRSRTRPAGSGSSSKRDSDSDHEVSEDYQPKAKKRVSRSEGKAMSTPPPLSKTYRPHKKPEEYPVFVDAKRPHKKGANKNRPGQKRIHEECPVCGKVGKGYADHFTKCYNCCIRIIITKKRKDETCLSSINKTTKESTQTLSHY